MDNVEFVKFIIMYGFEVIVVALVGIVLFAGLYQLVRDKVRGRALVVPEATRR